jgi:adenylate kinase family enzyme
MKTLIKDIKKVVKSNEFKNDEIQIEQLLLDFIKKDRAKQLILSGVSQQRELLELVTEIANSNQVYSNTRHKLWAKKLISSNCG